MPKEYKLPKPASCASDDQLESYKGQFDPAGDRRVLAEEILRLRNVMHEYSIPDSAIYTEPPVKPGKGDTNVDNDLI